MGPTYFFRRQMHVWCKGKACVLQEGHAWSRAHLEQVVRLFMTEGTGREPFQ